MKKAVLIATISILFILGSGFSGDSFGQEETDKMTAISATKPGGRGAGDTLRILDWEAPTILNPHLSRSTKDHLVCRITYEPLASFDKDGNLIPILATEVPSLENGGLAAGGKSVIWKLKKGVKWSDGELFTADDVLFTYQFISNPEVKSPSVAIFSEVESVQVIDPYTVKVNFKDVNPAWVLPFVGIEGAIIPQHIFTVYNGANAREAPANTLPVGTGPYRVIPPGIEPQEVFLLDAQLVETNKIVFEPNPYFRETDKPFFTRVEWRGGGTVEEAVRLVMQTGEIDYACSVGGLAPEELAKLKQVNQGRFVAIFGANIERVLLNRTDPNRETEDGERSSLKFSHPFFSDKKVRQAFAHAIDKEIIAKLYGLSGRPTTNNLAAPPQYASPDMFYEFNLDKAKALLDEAGWIDTNGDNIRDNNGIKLKVVYQAYANRIVQQTQQIIKKTLESIGIEVELKIVDSSIMFGSPLDNPNCVRRFNADMEEFSRRSVNPDPGAYMGLWTCSQIPQKVNNWAGANYERWCSPEYDALYQQSITELDPEKRRQLFIQMNNLQIEDVVMIPIVHRAEVGAVSRTIEGVDLTPWDKDTWNIKDWRRILP